MAIYKPSKLGQTELWFVMGVHQEICACMIYTLYLAVMICATLVNTHTHRPADTNRHNQLHY